MATSMRTTSRTRLAGLTAITGAALLLAGCGSSGGSSGAAAAPAGTSSAAGVSVTKTSLGSVLSDSDGRTLYMLTADKPGTSTCTGACVAAWPVVAPTSVHASGVSATTGSITRSDGTTQLTIDGLPVYTYAADTGAGSTNGQGVTSFGGTWWVLGSDGKPVTAAPPTMSGGRY